MSDTTLNKIKAHLKQSEGEPEHPYLDIKGSVTIGVGFKTDTADEFANLDLQVFKGGKWVTANGDEKRQAFQKMQEAKENRNGNFSPNADFYKGKTNIRMAESDQDAELDKRILEKTQGIKEDVVENAWNKLTDSQKMAVTDIAYANGSLDGFDNLKDALKEGDAKKMADEPTFFTDRKTGKRPLDRLLSNYQALSGLNREDADKRLQDLLKKNDAVRKNNPSNTPDPQSGSEDDPSGGPGFGNNGPTGQDDGADDDNPPRGSSSGDDSSGAGQPQSHNLTDPEAPSHTMELKLGEEGKGETMEIKPDSVTGPEKKERTPEQNLLLKDIEKSDGPLDEILAKDPRDWTEDEFMDIKKEVINLPAGPEQDRLDGLAMEFLEDKFGTGSVKYDAVGRMIDPKPIRSTYEKPVPAKTPDGEPLTGAVKKIGSIIADAAGGEGSADAVKGLQSGLNLLKSIMQRSKKTLPLAHDLKTDGVVGPKTRRALRLAASKLGRPKVEEGFALGRFGNFARDLQTGRADTRSLKPTTDKAFGPLFRPAVKVVRKEGITGRLPLAGPETGRG